MSAFMKKERQKIIDGYLAATGRNMFIAHEFIDWLEGEPDHPAYSLFFGKSDTEAAREYRIDLARRYASGLRIVTTTQSVEASVVHISVREYPAYISPVAGRRNGGGYQPFDPEDVEAVAELVRQGSTALRSWLERYRGAFNVSGIDVSAIEAIVSDVDGRKAG